MEISRAMPRACRWGFDWVAMMERMMAHATDSRWVQRIVLGSRSVWKMGWTICLATKSARMWG